MKVKKETVKTVAITVLLVIIAVLVTAILCFAQGVTYGTKNASKVSELSK